MASLSQQIMQLAEEAPEGTPLISNSLLDLGKRPAVDQALSRLARNGSLLRIGQGIYVRPVMTRFGPRPPSVEKVIPELSKLWNETIVPGGSHSATSSG